MGNCLRHPSSTKHSIADDCSDDDWDSSAAETGAFATKAMTTEVKIKITKKQLEELLGKVDVRDLRVEQVLAHLMNHSDGYQSLQKPWRPQLQSIPEDN